MCQHLMQFSQGLICAVIALGSVLIQWQTGSEIDNFGFRLRRSSNGNFFMSELIHFEASTITTGPGTSYSYFDSDLQPGSYTYWLIDVETDGSETVHDPVQVEVTRGARLYFPAVFR